MLIADKKSPLSAIESVCVLALVTGAPLGPTAGRSTVELAVEEAVVTGVVAPDAAAGPLAGNIPRDTKFLLRHFSLAQAMNAAATHLSQL